MICVILSKTLKKGAGSGDGFELLFAFTFLLRACCGYLCEPFFPLLADHKPWSFSANRYLKAKHLFHSHTTWAELKENIRPPSPFEVSFPHVAYYYPTHAEFKKYDGFAFFYAEPGQQHFDLAAFQMKRGRQIPSEDADDTELPKSFLVRGYTHTANVNHQEDIRGWRFVPKAEVHHFFGVSGAQWVPEHLDKLLL